MKQEELAQYLPPSPKHCCFLGSWCSACRESQRESWDEEDGVCGLSLARRRESPGKQGLLFQTLGWVCTWPHAGIRLCATNLGLGTGRGITVSGRGRCPWSAGDHDLGST